MKKILLAAILLTLILQAHAENKVALWQNLITSVKGKVKVVYRGDVYSTMMADGCYASFSEINDTIYCIQTVCAPICSSVVTLYDSEWNYIKDLKPDSDSPFMEARFDDEQHLIWIDNTLQLYDDEEKKYLK